MEKLFERDREAVIEYISKEPEYNLFLYGDMENFGFQSENVELFAEKYTDGRFDSLLLRYYDSYIFYSNSDTFRIQPVIEFLSQRNWGMLSGKGSLLKKLEPLLPACSVRESFISSLSQLPHDAPKPLTENYSFRALAPDDAEEIVAQYLRTDEFRANSLGQEEDQIQRIRENLSTFAKGWGLFCGTRLRASVMTSAKSAFGVMLIGVVTDRDLRNRGIATYLVTKLCRQCLQEKVPRVCLFYDNPAAGSIYRKIGFREIGIYCMMKKR